MSATKKENKEKITDSIEVLEQQKIKEKTCFVIMPIADTSGYDNGHFTRVYRHLIKPACELAGFTPIRADDVSSSNMIVVDILKKIVESDIAICDLSSRNPNVLYELGLRQAFNKKTIIIKDKQTISPFDVSGFRHTEYDKALRIDNIENEVISISKAIQETVKSKDDINSIVQLLHIKPASMDATKDVQLSDENTLIFNMLNEINERLSKSSVEGVSAKNTSRFGKNNNMLSLYSILKGNIHNPYSFVYRFEDNEIGKLLEINNDTLFFSGKSHDYSEHLNKSILMPNTTENLMNIYVIYTIVA